MQVYDGLKYKLSMEFPSSYPYTAPTVKFETPCYHPNVDQHGNICLDILKEKWSAMYDIKTLLMSLQSLLGGQSQTLLLLGAHSMHGTRYAFCMVFHVRWIFLTTHHLRNPSRMETMQNAFSRILCTSRHINHAEYIAQSWRSWKPCELDLSHNCSLHGESQIYARMLLLDGDWKMHPLFKIPPNYPHGTETTLLYWWLVVTDCTILIYFRSRWGYPKCDIGIINGIVITQ